MPATIQMTQNAMSVFNALKQSTHFVLFGTRYEVIKDELPSPEGFDIADLQYGESIKYKSMANRLGEQSVFEMGYARAINAVEERVLTFFKEEDMLPVSISWN